MIMMTTIIIIIIMITLTIIIIITMLISLITKVITGWEEWELELGMGIVRKCVAN